MRSAPLLLGILIVHSVYAQPSTIQRDTKWIRDLTETNLFMNGRPVAPQPAPDGQSVLFLRALSSRNPELALYAFDTATQKTREILNPETVLHGQTEQLSPEEKARRERSRTTTHGFTSFQISKQNVLLSLSGRLYTVNNLAQFRELKTSQGSLIDPQFSPDGQWISYVINNNLYIYNLATDQEQAITQGGTNTLSYGVAEFVAQEEMDRRSGYWWTQNSQSLVYEICDQSKVEIWNILDPTFPGNTPYPIHYPRPGKTNATVTLVIQSIHDKKGRHTIEWDHARFPYLIQVTPSGNAITVESRDQHHLELLKVDTQTGQTTTLISKVAQDWVETDPQMPRWLSHGEFLWTTQQAKGWQLELRQSDGQLAKILIPETEGYQKLGGITSSHIYYIASKDPTQSQLWRCALDGSDKQLIAPGTHEVEFGQTRIYVDNAQNEHSLPRTTVYKTDGAVIGELPSIAEIPAELPNTEFVKIQAAPDGTSSLPFNAVIIRPRNFNPKIKYPVIDYVYGGPHHNQVTRTVKPYFIAQWQADQGYIVVAIDGRGTPKRGRDWERAIYKNFDKIPLLDQVTVLKALEKKYSELNLHRVGITGWSFGGYLSALAVIRRPDIFKAGVAGAPVTDWLDYDTYYTERYLGLPGKETYDASSLLLDAPKLRRPLLLIHGTADDNVYFEHTLKLVNILFRNGRSFEFLPIIGTTHMTPNPLIRSEIERRTIEFFDQHLEPKAPR
jgi:dipeptidyl-peptidase 4